jgi:GDP-D-mannose dehydratase
MPRKQFTEEQIIATLRQAEAGMPVGEVCRRMGVSDPSFYRPAEVSLLHGDASKAHARLGWTPKNRVRVPRP